MTHQIADIEKLVRRSGIWNGSRQQSHAFRLTPDCFSLTADQICQLRNLGKPLMRALEGMGRIGTICQDEQLAKTKSWRDLRRVLDTEVPKRFRTLSRSRPSTAPWIFRVDMVEEEASGLLKIVEIEATKPHGFGYSTLMAHIAQHDTSAATLPGVASLLAKEIRRRRPDNPTLIILLSLAEVFYEAESAVLGDELTRQGIKVLILRENDNYDLLNEGVPLLLTLPSFTGSKLHAAADLVREQVLREAYQQGRLECLLPPKLFLGSKSLLAVLSNAGGNAEWEAILRSQIDAPALATLRSSLPTTALVEPETTEPLTGSWVLKEVLSSGAHGVTFSREGEIFREKLRAAASGRTRAVLQEEISCKTRSFKVWYPEEGGLRSEERHTRIAVFYAGGELADVTVTACRNPPVHGGREAIMLGSTTP